MHVRDLMPMQFSLSLSLSRLNVSDLFYSYSYYDAHTHRATVHSLSARNYGAYTFQVLNYYREIVLCVVTCCVYNYLLFLHDSNEGKRNEATATTAM